MATAPGLHVIGLDRTVQRMKAMEGKLKNLRATHKAAVVLLFRWVQLDINAEGKLHAESKYHWPPLAPSTIAARVRKNLRRTGKGRNILKRKGAIPISAGKVPMLRDTGNLRNRWDMLADNTHGKLKSMQDYSGTHEFGTRQVPQRKIFPSVRQAQELVFPLFKRHVQVSIQ